MVHVGNEGHDARPRAPFRPVAQGGTQSPPDNTPQPHDPGPGTVICLWSSGEGTGGNWQIDPLSFDPPAPGRRRRPGGRPAGADGARGRGVRPCLPSHLTTRGGARGLQQERGGAVRNLASPARSAGASSTTRGCRHKKNLTAIIVQPLAATPGGLEHDYSC